MTSKIGAKEAAARAQREQRLKEQKAAPLSKPHQMMVDDGLPPSLVRTGGSPKPPKPRDADAGVTLAPPRAVQAAIEKDFAEDPAAPSPADETTRAMVAAVDNPKKKAQDDPAAKKENQAMRTSKKVAKAKSRTAVKAKKTSSAKGDRSPLAVGEFIVANSPTMEQLSKRFGIDPHPMRSKVFAARHQLGFKIESKDGRYVGTAPKAAAKKA